MKKLKQPIFFHPAKSKKHPFSFCQSANNAYICKCECWHCQANEDTTVMKYALLPDEKPRRLTFYLAMEEYLARKVGDCEWFFMWQVKPTVIFGRHQLRGINTFAPTTMKTSWDLKQFQEFILP